MTGVASSAPWPAVLLSLRVAAVATLAVAVAGTALAWVLVRRRFPGRGALGVAVMLPLVLPPTVTGYYLLAALGRSGPVGRLLEAVLGRGVVFTWVAAAIASAVVALPLMVGSARAAIEEVDPRLEHMAALLGRSPWQVAWRVTLPLARRGIAAGVVLSFARAFGEFGATLIVAGDIPGRTETLPIAIYAALQSGDDRGALTLVALATLAGAAALAAVGRLAAPPHPRAPRR